MWVKNLSQNCFKSSLKEINLNEWWERKYLGTTAHLLKKMFVYKVFHQNPLNFQPNNEFWLTFFQYYNAI